MAHNNPLTMEVFLDWCERNENAVLYTMGMYDIHTQYVTDVGSIVVPRFDTETVLFVNAKRLSDGMDIGICSFSLRRIFLTKSDMDYHTIVNKLVRRG